MRVVDGIKVVENDTIFLRTLKRDFSYMKV